MPEATRKLTAKGAATRARIVETAAELIYRHGVHGTNNELLRRTAEVSGSQLNHYFPDKQSWVRAVIRWRADAVVDIHRRARLDSLPALRRWADQYIGWKQACEGGCGYGSLAAEVIKTEPGLHRDLAEGFERWEELFRRGLRGMRDRGDLRPESNPDHLAHVLMAAFQGGMLLAQAARDVSPLRDALDGALAYIATFAGRSRN